MKKQYLNGYNYELHTASLLTPSMVVLSNVLPFGKGRLEAQIMFDKGTIRVLITDGYKFLYDKQGFKGLKQAMNIAHGRMQDMTHETYSRLDNIELQPSEAVQELINEYATKL